MAKHKNKSNALPCSSRMVGRLSDGVHRRVVPRDSQVLLEAAGRSMG